MFQLIERHGLESVRMCQNRYYFVRLKQEIINEVVIKGCSNYEVSLDFALSSQGQLTNRIVQYKKKGCTIVEKTKGSLGAVGRKKKKT